MQSLYRQFSRASVLSEKVRLEGLCKRMAWIFSQVHLLPNAGGQSHIQAMMNPFCRWNLPVAPAYVPRTA